MNFLKYICIASSVLIFACNHHKKKMPLEEKLTDAATLSQTLLTDLDTIFGKDFTMLKAELIIDNKYLSFYNIFDYWDGGFGMHHLVGLKIINNNDTLNSFTTLPSSECQGMNLKYIYAPWGDSIDNEEGFNCTKVTNGSDTYIIQSGYYYGCGGTFCNNGAILILKFSEDRLIKGYLIGIDKSLSEAKPVRSYIKYEKLNLIFEVWDTKENMEYATVVISDSIQIISSGLSPFFCIGGRKD